MTFLCRYVLCGMIAGGMMNCAVGTSAAQKAVGGVYNDVRRHFYYIISSG